jgi:uncharacterized repeat protein (TIGR01451 family)
MRFPFALSSRGVPIRGKSYKKRVSLLTLALRTIAMFGALLTFAQDAAPQPAPGPDYVLILSTSVTGGMSSREAQAAIAAGYNVEIATPAQWASKTTVDFATYRALILGDPTCSGSDAISVGAAIADNPIWAAAVTGNVFINGTDPVFHHSQGGNTMTTAGVRFAADEPGKTGLYASLSCYYHGTAPNRPVPLLNNLSEIPGAMFTVKGVGCHNNVHIVATHPALGGMTDASLSNWGCSVHEAFDSWPADFEVLVIAVGTGGEFTAADGTVGTPYVLARGVTVISDIRLTPEDDTNPVGTSHTLTASVTVDGSPEGGIVVTFTVEAGPNAGTTGTCTTDATGQCTFTYTSNGIPGTDIIRARAVVRGKTQTSNAASKTWEAAREADIAITKSCPPEATAGTPFSCTVTVTNNGPAGATNVIVSDTVAGGLITSITSSQGTCAAPPPPATPTADCNLGNMAAGQIATVTVVLQATTVGPVTNTATARAAEVDPTPGNNIATATTNVSPGAPASVVVTPPTDTNRAGEKHCVTATVRDAFGNPVSGVTVRFTVTGANSAGGIATTNLQGEAVFCYTGTNAGTDTITAHADTNNNGVVDNGEPRGTATKIYVAGPPATVVVDPPAAVNTVDSTHCVTATVRDAFGNPVSGVVVRFRVTGSVNTGGSATTNAAGQATFCYTGPPLPGSDVITAFADTDRDGTQDVGEPSGGATKTWALPVTTPLCEIKITNGGWIIATNGDRATFGGNAKSSESGDTQGQEEYQDHGPAQPMNVHSINVLAIVCDGLGEEASIYGQATIDGSGSFFYRIKVRDRGEPGAGTDTYWMLLQTGYTSGDQVLRGGNVQIHRQ